MKNPLFLSLALGTLLGACARTPEPAQPAMPGAWVDAGGVVEPVGEERLIIPQRTGRLEQVLIDEGDHVNAGQLLAQLENASERAAVEAAEAEIALRRAELQRLENGARSEELRVARALDAEADALDRQARSELARRQHLAERRLISEESLEEARTRAATAAASREHAAAQLALLLAGSRSEELDAARAALAAATARAHAAVAELEKTRIRAPIDGIVLKRVLSAGETVTPLTPEPLATIGNMDRLVVRSEIDELDIARVRSGARATVRADAFPGRQFPGQVSRVARRMGPRSQLSDDPTQRRDARIMEAMIELDPGAPLPVGLQVDVRIEAATAEP